MSGCTCKDGGARLDGLRMTLSLPKAFWRTKSNNQKSHGEIEEVLKMAKMVVMAVTVETKP